MPSVGYIAYIYEAGDDGIKKIRTTVDGGASEWMVISAVVIHAENEPYVLPWLRATMERAASPQLRFLHFHRLDHAGKLAVCKSVAQRQAYLFSTISYKRTMEGHSNPAAERVNINKTAHFYAWMPRLLLEQITNFVGQRTFVDYGGVTTVRSSFQIVAVWR